MTPFSFEPIGWLKTPFIDKFGTPRQGILTPSVEATVEWAPHCPAEVWMEGLEGFSHLWLITVFHANYGLKSPNKIHPPRLGGARVGVLASRSPHRPNPLGLTLARIKAVQGRKLILSDVDLIDGTPLLDLKPYVPEADEATNPRGGWVEQNPWPKLQVKFTAQSEGHLQKLYQLYPAPVPMCQLQDLIVQTLSVDPRAVADRAETERPDGRPRWYWLRLYDYDIGFYFTSEGVEVGEMRFALHSPLYQKLNSL